MEFDKITRRLEYSFKDSDLLVNAFRHASYVNEQSDSDLEDNERLEFLGDAVLELAISHLLMERFPGAEEGDLSRMRASVVDEKGLFKVAMGLELGDCLLLGRGEEQSGGREKPSILSDTMEALLGALYLDAGFDRVLEVVEKLFGNQLDGLSIEAVRDFKSLLQEYTQRTFRSLPRYRMVEETGPAHDKRFRVILTLNEEVISEGEGKSKKEAEQRAAEEAYICLIRD